MNALQRALGLACLVMSSVAGQEVLWTAQGTQDVTSLMCRCRQVPPQFLSDIDGDGYQDLIGLGRDFVASTTTPGAGWVYSVTIVYSGYDGSWLRKQRVTHPEFEFHALAAVGDMDGDGCDDYARTVRPVYRKAPVTVEVCSGKDDTVLWQVTGPWDDDFGGMLRGELDVNGDQRPDLLVMADREPPYGAVYAFDHAGRQLFRVTRSDDIWELGKLGGDLDRDGCEDFLVASQEPLGRGAVWVYSGRTTQVLASGTGEYSADGLGIDGVAGVGDVDRDGLLDFSGVSNGGPGSQGPLFRVFSGRDGSVIYSWRWLPGGGVGSSPRRTWISMACTIC